MQVKSLIDKETWENCSSHADAKPILHNLRKQIGYKSMNYKAVCVLSDRQRVFLETATLSAVNRDYSGVVRHLYKFLDETDTERDLSNSEFFVLNLVLIITEDGV